MCIMEYGKLNISIDQYQRTIAEKSGDIVAWLDGLSSRKKIVCFLNALKKLTKTSVIYSK